MRLNFKGGDDLQKKMLKYFTMFMIGGLVYGLIEISARGYTHISMGVLGAVSMLVIHLTNDARREGMNYFIQLSVITLFITSIELLTGEILNVRLGMNIWDYSDIPLNFDGQICLPFVGIWFVLSAAGVWVDDFVRWKIFGEGKKLRNIKTARSLEQF